VARPLPRDLLVDLTAHKRLMLCLDYDGIIAPTTDHPEDAKPLEGATRAIRALSDHPDDIVIAIVSGREARTTRRMLRISRRLYFIGLHGIEILDEDDHRELLVQVKHCLPALHTVREWLMKEAREADGFFIEDKEYSLALHYRNARPELARDICRQLDYFVAHMIRGLRISRGDMVEEVIPSNAGGKGFALIHLLERLKDKSLMPVFFGSDPSDEEAFFAVRRAGGATILVGPDRDTHAEYFVDGPTGVIDVLNVLADSLDRPADGATP
jgi:trehalose-phosphatase